MRRFPPKKGEKEWTKSAMIKTLSQKCRDCGRKKKKTQKDIANSDEDDIDQEEELEKEEEDLEKGEEDLEKSWEAEISGQ